MQATNRQWNGRDEERDETIKVPTRNYFVENLHKATIG